MYYIDNYRKQAVDKIIPYLITFPEIIKIIENSADRYQAIEDVLWQIATNFRVEDSRGIFLNAHANNEVVNIIYTDKVDDAFTYGTDRPLLQAYGTGHYYSQASYISGIRKTFSEDKLIRAVLAKIIQNNTSATIEELIEGLKLLYNAEHVSVFESQPLNINLMLSGKNLELSSSGNYENIKQMLPACVALKNIFVNPYTYDIFKYDKNSSYGDTRYPIRVGETIDTYRYISNAITLRNIDKEYILTNYASIDDGMFICICGKFENINDGGTIISSNIDVNNGFNLETINEDDKTYIAIEYNGVLNKTNIEINNTQDYTITVYYHNNQLKLWYDNSVSVKGAIDEDSSYLSKKILYTTPTFILDNFTPVNAPIYINCKNIENIQSNFSDFTYYVLLFGVYKNNNIKINEHYNTCYGEKQILFNCIENKNHLNIFTSNKLIKDITTKQSHYNYKLNYSNGKYIYLDGKSGIKYQLSNNDIECNIDEFKLSFDLCQPVNIQNSLVFNNILNKTEENSNIIINEFNGFTFYFTAINDDGEKIETFYNSPDNIINVGEFASYTIHFTNKNIYFYKNNKLLSEYIVIGSLKDIPKNLLVGYDNELSNFYKGFIKNIKLFIKGTDQEKEYTIDLNAPLKYSLQNENAINRYENYGARFITTPQLINDTTKLDLFGNNLVGER